MSARILIVDDVAVNIRLLTAKLRSEYFQVETASDGFTAINLASSWQPDIVLLDVMMPGMDGYECCRALKENIITSHIPIIMITALGERDERIKGLEAGADEFLTKPVDYATLIIRLRSLIRLKRVLDEWRLRGDAAQALGLDHYNGKDPEIAQFSVTIIGPKNLLALQLSRDLIKFNFNVYWGTTSFDASRGGEEIPDLFIITISTNDDESLQTISSVRSNKYTSDIPILLVVDDNRGFTALSKAFELGSNDCLLQPFDFPEFVVRCNNLIKRSVYQRKLHERVDRAIELVAVDPLTGLFNRRYLERHLDVLGRINRGINICILLVDIDFFKKINDEFGHGFGDCVIQRVSSVLRATTRAFDTVTRYGGEEFVIVLPGTTLVEASNLTNCLLDAVRNLKGPNCVEKFPQITVSVGVAVSEATAVSPLHILDNADKALYRAKAAGRDRFEIAII